MEKRVIVTGAAGFIGYHLSKLLNQLGYSVIGIDNLNEYYDAQLKKDRLSQLEENSGFSFYKVDLCDHDAINKIFAEHKPEYVVNLAAQAGVRYSLEDPFKYTDSNVTGFLSILEACRHNPVKHLLFASTSSVYGANTRMPFSEHDAVSHQISLYAATKRANEAMAHSYSALFDIPVTGLRFFTVYGPWGRPDMALFKFTKAILQDTPIDVYNHGEMKRDFTYVEDIAESIGRLLDKPPDVNESWDANNPDPSSSFCKYRICNIGNSQPIELISFINVIEKALNKKARKNLMEMQPGDVKATSSDVSDLEAITEFKPKTSIEEGVKHFVDWYLEYYHN